MTLNNAQTQMYARHLVELGFIENVVNQMGYSSTELIEASKDLPYHTLLVNLEPDSQGRQRQMTLTFYPIDIEEFGNTLLLQYFTELPFAVKTGVMDEINKFFIYLNNKTVVGHFGITQGQNKLNHRYVQTLPSEDVISEGVVADTLMLFNYTSMLFGSLVEAVASGEMSASEAQVQADQIG